MSERVGNVAVSGVFFLLIQRKVRACCYLNNVVISAAGAASRTTLCSPCFCGQEYVLHYVLGPLFKELLQCEVALYFIISIIPSRV